RQPVGRLIHQIARKVLRVGNDRSGHKSLLRGRNLVPRKASQADRFDLLLFLVGLVFVGLEVRRNEPFSERLCLFASRQGPGGRKGKTSYPFPLERTERGSRDFA